MNRKFCYFPQFSSAARVFSRENASFFSIAKVFVAKFAGKTVIREKLSAPKVVLISVILLGCYCYSELV